MIRGSALEEGIGQSCLSASKGTSSLCRGLILQSPTKMCPPHPILRQSHEKRVQDQFGHERVARERHAEHVEERARAVCSLLKFLS